MGGLLLRALLGLLARLPLPINHALGAGLGWLAWLLPNDLKRISPWTTWHAAIRMNPRPGDAGWPAGA